MRVVLCLAFSFILSKTVATEPAIRGQSDDITFGNFIHFPGHKLFGAVMKKLKLKSSFDCMMECTANTRCTSTNVNTTSDIADLLECELLDFDKYEFEQNLTKVKGVDHYALPENTIPEGCFAIEKQKPSDVYRIQPILSPSFDAYCDMVTNGGGWTIFQRRVDGSVDFYRGWHDYKQGFGNKNGEYWLGLDRIHAMTSKRKFKLRIDLEDFENNTRYAEYESFSVANEADKYRLSIGKYSGNAGDCLTRHNNMAFSTKDRDNDVYSASCAVNFNGAWWYSSCHASNLNGLYLRGKTSRYATSVTWSCFKGQYYSLKRAEMKIRPQ